jgi:hypothetical protein
MNAMTGVTLVLVLFAIGFGWLILYVASVSMAMGNGTWNAAMDECYNGTGVVLISDAPKLGPNTNPFAVITGDYYFDCTKDVSFKDGDVLRVETLYLKTIHVRR